MVIFIILCIIGIVLYLASKNSSQENKHDYKHTGFYKKLSYDDKLRVEIISVLENEIKKAIELSYDKFDRNIYISAVIADKKEMLLKNRVQISKQSNVPLYLVIEIIDECCLGAYTTYIKQ